MSTESAQRGRAEDGPRGRGDGARLPGHPDRPRVDRRSSSGSTSTTTAPRRRSTSSPASASRRPHQIVIQPWDRSVLGAIEKAIIKSDIGPDAERRRDGRPAEHPAAHRGASQGASSGSSTSAWRRHGSRSATSAATRPTTLKKEERDGEVGADEAHRQLEALQRTTDRFVGEVDRVGQDKEQEVLEV